MTSESVESDPEDSPAPVRVRVPKLQIADGDEPIFIESCIPVVPGLVKVEVATFQTSEASVPKVESERVLLAQTAVGMVEARDVEAVRTVASV